MQDKLTDLEIVKIETFCADAAMFNAVHKVVLGCAYNPGVLIKGEELSVKNPAFNLIANTYSRNENVSNESLGERLRGLYEGVDACEDGFTQLKRITSKKESVKEEKNEAI